MGPPAPAKRRCQQVWREGKSLSSGASAQGARGRADLGRRLWGQQLRGRLGLGWVQGFAVLAAATATCPCLGVRGDRPRCPCCLEAPGVFSCGSRVWTPAWRLRSTLGYVAVWPSPEAGEESR